MTLPARLPRRDDDGLLVLPADMSLKEWLTLGRDLGKIERHAQWWIGEWWMYGETRGFENMKELLSAPTWTGPSYQTCINAANCCRRVPGNRRRLLVPFSHHLEVASLPEAEADARRRPEFRSTRSTRSTL